MQHPTIRGAGALLILLAGACAAWPALAQVQTRASRACELVACSGSGLAASAIGAAARGGAAAPKLLPGQSSAMPGQSRAPGATRDPWGARFQGRVDPEEDMCILNFGFGAELGRHGAVATHALGQRQVWRGEDGNARAADARP